MIWTKSWVCFVDKWFVDIDDDETDGSVLYRVTYYEDGDPEDLNGIECRPSIDLLTYVYVRQENKQC